MRLRNERERARGWRASTMDHADRREGRARRDVQRDWLFPQTSTGGIFRLLAISFAAQNLVIARRVAPQEVLA